MTGYSDIRHFIIENLSLIKSSLRRLKIDHLIEGYNEDIYICTI